MINNNNIGILKEDSFGLFIELNDKSIDLILDSKKNNFRIDLFLKHCFKIKDNKFYIISEFDSKLFNEIETFFNTINIKIKNQTTYNFKIETLKKKFEIGNKLKSMIFEKSIEFDKEYIKFKKLIDNNFKRPMNDFQLHNAFFAYKLKTSCNFSSPGSGKTSTIFATYLAFFEKKYVNKLMIIGPKSSLISWKDEYEIIFGRKPKVFVSEMIKESVFEDLIVDQNNFSLIWKSYDFVFFNYDFLLNKNSIQKILMMCDMETFLIFDESHKIKNSLSKRYESCFKLAKKTQHKAFLTGTPIPNGYKDIYTTLKMINNFEYDSFWKINENEFSKLAKNELIKFKHKFSSFFIRTTKSDLQIPSPNDDFIINYSLTELEKNIYKRCFYSFSSSYLELYIRLLQTLIDPTMLTKKISQELDNYNDEPDEKFNIEKEISLNNSLLKLDNEIKHFENNLTSKMKGIIQKIIELILNNKKVIVWSTFISPIFKLEKHLKNNNIKSYILYGKTKYEDREKIIKSFKNNKNPCVLITNPQTLAESISLHKHCHEAIYIDFNYNLVHMLQSKDRIHRLGISKDEIPNYYYFILNDEKFNIEKEIFKSLKEKEKIMLELINDSSLNTLNDFNMQKYIESVIENVNRGLDE